MNTELKCVKLSVACTIVVLSIFANKLSAVTTVVVNVEDYYQAGFSDYDAIRAAIDDAAAITGSSVDKAEIRFQAAKQYRIAAPYQSDLKTCFQIENVEDITFRGNGCWLIIEEPLNGLMRFKNCKNMTVHNFRVDYDPIPWMEGYVRQIDSANKKIYVELNAGSPIPTEAHFSQASSRWGYLLHPTINGRLKANVSTHYYIDIVDGSPNAQGYYGITFTSAPMYDFAIGDRFVQLARNAPCFSLVGSENVNIVTVHGFASSASLVSSSHCDGVSVRHCRTLVKSGRWKSINADCCHFQSTRNVEILNCKFTGQSDDALALYTTPIEIASVSSGATNTVELKSVKGFRNGDRLLIVDKASRETLGMPLVASFDTQMKRVTLSASVSGMNVNTTEVYNVSLCSGFEIADNQISNGRRYGLFLKANNGTVSNNSFTGLSDCAINVSNLPSEGAFVSDVVIDNSTIQSCGFSSHHRSLARLHKAAITIYGTDDLNSTLANNQRIHNDIRISNTTMNHVDLPFFFVGNAAQVDIDGTNSLKQGTGFDTKTDAGIVIDQSGYVSVSGISSDIEPFYADISVDSNNVTVE